MNINQLICKLLACLLFMLPIFEAFPSACAQEKAIKILHKPISAKDLPSPGFPFPVKITVQGVDLPDNEVRAFIVSDGRMLDVPLKGSFDLNDNVIYEGEFIAPLAQIYYQFIFYRQDGPPVLSKRYFIKRSCLPDIELAKTEIPNELMGKERAVELIRAAKELEKDLHAYTEATRLLDELWKEYNLRQTNINNQQNKEAK